METALYYTVSTVSQTLAGALGMLAAFLAIRVSSLDTAVRGALSELAARASVQLGGLTGDEWPDDGSVTKAILAWENRIGAAQGVGYHQKVLLQAKRVHASRGLLLRDARRAFAASACVMTACFAGLASAPLLASQRWLAVLALTGTVLAGLGCLLWYGWIVVRALE